MLQIAVFNIGAGQCILFYPKYQKEYAMFVDCHESEDFSPIDFLVGGGLLPNDGARNILSNLTITNYDHDHFSALPKIMEDKGIHIDTVRLPKNITSEELKEHKSKMPQTRDGSKALEKICHLKDNYTGAAEHHQPPYSVKTFYLEQSELDSDEINTNHLSQMVFVEYGKSHICVAGDLEATAWEKLLKKQGVIEGLQMTNVFVAAHHGRENGYHADIFQYCSPECIIISDKELMYGTQDAMAQTYASHTTGQGIPFEGQFRKVLTTRNDGHILISFAPDGSRAYQQLTM